MSVKGCFRKEFPERVEIEIASACNLRCMYCPRNHMDKLKGFMDLPLFKKLMDETAQYPDTIVVLHRRGESLLHPDFTNMCAYAKGKFKEVQLATNATLLDKKRSSAIIEAVDFVSFSIDLPDVFDRTRKPARYGDVEKNIFEFLKLNRGRTRTQVSMVKTPDTPPENPRAFEARWAGKVDRIRIYEEHSKDGRFGSLAAKRKKRLPCIMPFYEVLVYSDGKIGRCNHDWNGAPMGDATIDTIKEIWSRDQYKELRIQQETMNITDDVCKGCDSWYAAEGVQGTGEIIE